MNNILNKWTNVHIILLDVISNIDHIIYYNIITNVILSNIDI